VYKKCAHMCINAKMISVETIPKMRELGIKNSGEVNSNMIYLMDCKKFCKCQNILPPITSIIKKNKSMYKQKKKQTHKNISILISISM
jgi:hypothetical protein